MRADEKMRMCLFCLRLFNKDLQADIVERTSFTYSAWENCSGETDEL